MTVAVEVTEVYEEDFHLIPTREFEIHHEEDGIFVRHAVTDVWHKELYQTEDDKLETVRKAISTLTYQVYIHRLQEQKNAEAAEVDDEASDVLTNLVQRVEKIEHALRMR